MSHECSSHSASTLDLADTVGDLVRRQPDALEILKALGINHCCGAHLTLAEAAAAAGVSLDALRAALGAGRVPA